MFQKQDDDCVWRNITQKAELGFDDGGGGGGDNDCDEMEQGVYVISAKRD